jgi:hypothetical protein
MNPFAIAAVAALIILALTEVLITRQKSRMKKEFLEELDRLDRAKKEQSSEK